jgi:hypothetical protein
MNKFTKISSRVAAVALALGLSTSQAADNATVTVTSTVPTILSLEVSQSTVSIPLVDADYNIGASDDTAAKEAIGAHTVSIRSNITWTLNVKADAATFSGTGSTGKAVSNLEIQTPASTWAALTTADVPKETGAGGGYLDNQFSVDYRFNSNLQSDLPGTYAVGVVFTVVPEEI